MANFPDSSDKIHHVNLKAPIALDPRNFTSLERTPWAGRALAAEIKRDQANSASQKIGESWEVSCDPDAPSKLRDTPEITLPELIARFPVACLSSELVAKGRTTCDILIKLLNADSPLSLQIHPSDNNQSLKPNECGKPESWLVLDAEDNAGLYLGFKKELPLEEIRQRLESGSFTPDILQFVPVKPGDYFEIEPHVPHAIGPGVILLEPQRIIAGKSGKTWRLWDWNRKYNPQGELDLQHGKARELHINESMPLLDPSRQSGPGYVKSLRKIAVRHAPSVGVTVNMYPANPWYQTISVSMAPHSKLRLANAVGYGCATIIAGQLSTWNSGGQRVNMCRGESYFIPAASLPIELATRDAAAHLTLVIPAGTGVQNRDPSDISTIFC